MAGIDACGRARKCGNSTRNAFPNSLDRLATCPSINNRETQVASIDLERLDIKQLPELLAKAQSELASREKQGRTDLRAELERRVAAEGYKIADIFPELGAASSSSARRKWPAKYRNPQNPDTDLERPWTDPEVGAGDPRRTRHRQGRLQVDPDVSDPFLELSQRARGKSGGRRGRVEAVPKRGAAREVARTTRAPETSRNRGEHPEFDARESRVLRDRTPTRQVGTPPCSLERALEVRVAGTRPGRAGLRRGRAEGARDDGRGMRQVARVHSPAIERGHAPLGDPPWGQVPPRPSVDRLAKPRELALRFIGLDVGPPRAFDAVPHLRHPPVAPGAKQPPSIRTARESPTGAPSG